MIVLTNLKLVMQGLNVIFDPLNELGLVFPDGTADVRAHKQGVEAREDAEHLVGVLGCAELVTETSCYTGLNAVDSLVISLHGSLPCFRSFLANIQTIHFLHILIGQVHLLLYGEKK